MVLEDSIDIIRTASRQLVRELGFMGGDFAGTTLSPSAVHALIEIEHGNVTARELGVRLHLEKSSVSRLLRKLVDAGDLHEGEDKNDARLKLLSLTAAGRERVAAIHRFARDQVASALVQLTPDEARTVGEGLHLYAGALTGAVTRAKTGGVRVEEGYRPGLIARITEMHALYYARTSGFGQPFESVVASGLSEFCGRLHHAANGVWTVSRNGRILGSVAIDGQDMGDDIAHLRWFIVDDGLRGTGSGKALLDAALAFVDAQGFAETHLWTFSGLHAARHLYEARGFVLAEEHPGTQWGNEVLEQRFVRLRP